jgi:predicted TIM-barrel fold metal-dependent hydrolase
VPADRVLSGTDRPSSHRALTLTRVLLATEEAPEVRRAVLFDNAAALLR